VKAGLRQRLHRPDLLRKLDAMETQVVTVLPQTFPGASGQMDVKLLLQHNGSAV
jgi:hypothetical protein